MAASLRAFCGVASRQSIRPFSSTCATHAGIKWRLENGLARGGSEYGPLTDLPDWSFADGRPAPPLKGQIRRQKQREEFARRAVYLNAEVDEGMKQWSERKEAEKRKEEHDTYFRDNCCGKSDCFAQGYDCKPTNIWTGLDQSY